MNAPVRSPKQLGVAVRRFRRLRKYTQAALANKAGLRQGTISDVEGGLEGVRLSTIMDLLRALDLELVIQPRTTGLHAEIEDMF
ncbi:helix-turn-helix domain-containing protein [uncultured Maricaulis sp.]|uniref:helix-turn-helix domain-containing protein n=1 Tax=uncultured Maricaulis sp. TaxID=174710 RepID=UPI0030DC9080|tara:strand:+ start:292270 stop:292521 length:252 start_codon:yes stop_codon:yes gene_type:complete